MSDDPAQDEIAAVIRATTSLVTNEPNLVGFDFADLRTALKDGGSAVFGQGEAAQDQTAPHAPQRQPLPILLSASCESEERGLAGAR